MEHRGHLDRNKGRRFLEIAAKEVQDGAFTRSKIKKVVLVHWREATVQPPA